MPGRNRCLAVKVSAGQSDSFIITFIMRCLSIRQMFILCYTGLGEPTYFYVTAVMNLNGAMMGIYFLFGTFVRYARIGLFSILVSCEFYEDL